MGSTLMTAIAALVKKKMPDLHMNISTMWFGNVGKINWLVIKSITVLFEIGGSIKKLKGPKFGWKMDPTKLLK